MQKKNFQSTRLTGKLAPANEQNGSNFPAVDISIKNLIKSKNKANNFNKIFLYYIL